VLATDPTNFQSKTDELRNLVMNAHQLINEYRPHQARESLIIMMEEQLEKKKAEIDSVKRMKEKVAGLLGNLDGEDEKIGDGERDRQEKSKEKRWKDGQRAVWAALDDELAT
jgi:mediator of RNA polymerase II transcription subunit 7